VCHYLPWKSRKRNPGRGQHFQTEGNPTTVKDMAQKEYFKEILKEGTTYDINEIISKMRGQGRSTMSNVNSAQKELDKAEEILALAQGKIEVINSVLETLDEIKASGRTRIGDSELKNILRHAIMDAGLPPSVLDKV
jgi:septation ring formation regulator EzrA